MTPSLTVSARWFATLTPTDWFALAFYFSGLLGYRFFLSFMLKKRRERLFLGKLQQYRTAWIEEHSGSVDSLVVIQSLRNTIMSASFLASTAIIIIIGTLNILLTQDVQGKETLKILLLIILLTYTFFNFTWYIREVNYMSFILNIPKEKLEAIEGKDSTAKISQMFLASGIYFSLGMRGYYFLVPILMWFFNPLLMVCATGLILYILLVRDLAA